MGVWGPNSATVKLPSYPKHSLYYAMTIGNPIWVDTVDDD